MTLQRLDHVNVVTARLAEMSAFYADTLGLPAGPRPPFGFDGAWHYCGGLPAVHLVARQPGRVEGVPPVEHFAFRATGLAGWLQRLRAAGVPHHLRAVPGGRGHSLNLRDPDGNHVEVLFGPGDLPADDGIAGHPSISPGTSPRGDEN